METQADSVELNIARATVGSLNPRSQRTGSVRRAVYEVRSTDAGQVRYECRQNMPSPKACKQFTHVALRSERSPEDHVELPLHPRGYVVLLCTKYPDQVTVSARSVSWF